MRKFELWHRQEIACHGSWDGSLRTHSLRWAGNRFEIFKPAPFEFVVGLPDVISYDVDRPVPARRLSGTASVHPRTEVVVIFFSIS